MTEVDEHGRTDPPVHASEIGTLRGYLDFQRRTFAWKCAGLDAAGLAATVGVSSMTLGGMLKHLSLVESTWFGYRFGGQAPTAPWDTVDWDADPDWDWNSAARDTPEQLRGLWEESVRDADRVLDEALARGGLEQSTVRPLRDGATPSLRWVLCHMIEEYARHNGHADLIRESVDGVTGE